MTPTTGTPIPAPLIAASGSSFGTHYDILGIGGYKIVRSLTERNSIPVDSASGKMNSDGRSSGRRSIGMKVYVIEEDTTYRLSDDDFFTYGTDADKYASLSSNGNWVVDDTVIPEGISDLQGAYEGSTPGGPQIVTNNTVTAFYLKSGTSGGDSDEVFGVMDSSNNSTFSVTGEGNVTASGWVRSDYIDSLTSTLNIGSTNASTIIIGNESSTIIMMGTVTEVETENATYVDTLITLNKGGGVDTGIASGFEIEEDGLAAGYFKTSIDRMGWAMKAPGAGYSSTFDQTDLTGHVVYTMPNSSGTLALAEDIDGVYLPLTLSSNTTVNANGNSLYFESSTGVKSVGIGDRKLYDSLSVQSVAYEVRGLVNAADTVFTVHWNDLLLKNHANATVTDWGNGYYNDSAGNKMFRDHQAWTTTNEMTADFEYGRLNDYSGAPSISWLANGAEKQLIHNYVTSLDWKEREGIDEAGEVVFKWSTGDLDLQTNSIRGGDAGALGDLEIAFHTTYLDITTDAQGYAESWTYMDSNQNQVGYGANTYLDVNTSEIELIKDTLKMGIDSTAPFIYHGGFKTYLQNIGTGDRTVSFQAASGTVAFTSDIITITASNGLTKSVNDIQLGGTLTSDINIDGPYSFILGTGSLLSSVDLSAGSSGSDNSGFYMDSYEAGFQHAETGGVFGFVNVNTNETVLEWQQTGMTSPSRIVLNSTGIGLDTQNNSAYHAYLKTTNITADRTVQFPNASGTLALVADLGSYIPFTLVSASNVLNINGKGFTINDGSVVKWHVGDNLFYDNSNIESLDLVNRTLKSSAGTVLINYATSGSVRLSGNLGINGNSYGSGVGVEFMLESSTPSTGDPTNGSLREVKNGAVFFRLSDGSRVCVAGKSRIGLTGNATLAEGETFGTYTGTGGHTITMSNASVQKGTEITFYNGGSGSITINGSTLLPTTIVRLKSDGTNWV